MEAGRKLVGRSMAGSRPRHRRGREEAGIIATGVSGEAAQLSSALRRAEAGEEWTVCVDVYEGHGRSVRQDGSGSASAGSET